MCGRYALSKKFIDLKAHYGARGDGVFEGNFNVAPTQRVPVLVDRDGVPELRMMKWGFVPAWSAEPKMKINTINARAETVATSKLYASAFMSSRCVVPADGFYEWVKDTKQPWYFSPREGIFSFAGLWNSWTPPDGGTAIDTFTIITTAANDVVGPVHNRMPAVLGGNEVGGWMSPKTAAADLQGFITSYPAGKMQSWMVSKSVNTPKNCDASCVDRLDSL